jgi:hypothetical protein
VGGEMVVRCGGDGITEAMGGRRTGRAGGGGFHDGGNAERLRAGGEPVRKARGGWGGEARQQEDDGKGGRAIHL